MNCLPEYVRPCSAVYYAEASTETRAMLKMAHEVMGITGMRMVRPNGCGMLVWQGTRARPRADVPSMLLYEKVNLRLYTPGTVRLFLYEKKRSGGTV